MTAVDTQDALKRAIAALKAGNKLEARRLLESILATDRLNEQAWLWMSGVVDNDAERVICLENVLTLNPYNERARQGLERLGTALPPLPITRLVPAVAPPREPREHQAGMPHTLAVVEPRVQTPSPLGAYVLPVPGGESEYLPGAVPPGSPAYGGAHSFSEVALARPQVADNRLYITVVVILSLMLICTVVGIVAAVVFFAPAS